MGEKDDRRERQPVVLGRRYKDKIHGIEGVAVARYEYLTGCDRVALQFVKDGEIKDYTFDEPQLVLVEEEKEKAEEEPKTEELAAKDRGGPRMGPSSKDPASR